MKITLVLLTLLLTFNVYSSEVYKNNIEKDYGEEYIRVPFSFSITPKYSTSSKEDSLGKSIHNLSMSLGYSRSNGLKGLALSGLASLVDDKVKGVQISGLMNKAKDVKGVQISSINFSNKVSGAQIGLVNIATEVKGVQLGLINKAKSLSGVPMGLFNYIEDGVFKLSYSYDSDELHHFAIKHGNENLYTIYEVGTQIEESLGFNELGVGVGTQFNHGRFNLEVELQNSLLWCKKESLSDNLNITKASLIPSIKLHDGFMISIGVAYNVQTNLTKNKLEEKFKKHRKSNSKNWPSYFVGLSYDLF